MSKAALLFLLTHLANSAN